MIGFVAFGAMISFMVYRCIQTPIDLVTKEYYKDELAYQQVIDGRKKADALSEPIRIHRQGGAVELQMPVEMKNKSVQGTVLFYNVAHAVMDRRLILKPDEEGRQSIDTEGWGKGLYQVKISWQSGGVQYFTEETMNLE